ncbi:MAG: helix-turn-helix transcriptional regulator [Chloroflexi bacterium]|nr:helix-turn-helix transcriptional regulator [Chloroflexota bacterium]
MNQHLTFGETIRRLRREQKWSLGKLAEETGLSYSYLSRVENDSASPQADAVARLAQALDGDLRELLELAACLPDVILQRLSRREEGSPAGSLNRSAHRDDQTPRGSVGALVAELAIDYGFQVSEAHSVADAIERLVNLPPEQRASITRLILTLDSNRDDQ